MKKKNKINKPLLIKIVSSIFLVIVLASTLIIPSVAYSFGEYPTPTSDEIENFYTYMPVKSITSFASPYGYDPYDDLDTTYQYINGGFNFTPVNDFVVHNSINDAISDLKDYYIDNPSLNPSTFDFASASEMGTTSSLEDGTFFDRVEGVRYQQEINLLYKRNYCGYDMKDFDLSNPSLLLTNIFTVDFTTPLYTVAHPDSYSYIVTFDNYMLQKANGKRPYLHVSDSYLPDATTTVSTRVEITYWEEVRTSGGYELESEVYVKEYNQSSWSSNMIYLLPLEFNSSEHVIESMKVYVTIKDDQNNVIVPHRFSLNQIASTNPDISFIDIVDESKTITKWRSISDITSWLGDTVASFFDIEILPGFRLSYVLGIVITIPIVIWILKLMAGG